MNFALMMFPTNPFCAFSKISRACSSRISDNGVVRCNVNSKVFVKARLRKDDVVGSSPDWNWDI
jgi:hypothetical protein